MRELLTKQAIKRLKEAETKVTLWNGCFNRAVRKIKINRYEIELRVEVTHPMLEWQCGNKNSVELVFWKSHSGRVVKDIPEELKEVVAKMKQEASMTDEEAYNISKENKEAFLQSMKELGII
jgi:hypothetical protein